MKRIAALILTFCGIGTLAGAADKTSDGTGPDWQNASVVERNRMPMRATFHTDNPVMSLHGLWKFKWYETPEGRLTTFYSIDTEDNAWGTMPVPGIWEVNGYGDPLYVNIGYCSKTTRHSSRPRKTTSANTGNILPSRPTGPASKS